MRSFNFLTYVILLLMITSFASCDYFKTNKAYKEAIEQADAALTKENYKQAKTLYTKAADYKPEETYPKDKIKEINKILLKQKASKYKAQVKNADNLFNKKSYDKAKASYGKASKLMPKEKYPKEMIQKINKILADIKKQKEYENYPYHIVVGCFMVESNATRMHKKLKAEGYNSRIIEMPNGRFDAVTLASYPSLTEGYNNLKEAQEKFGEEVWVYKH